MWQEFDKELENGSINAEFDEKNIMLSGRLTT